MHPRLPRVVLTPNSQHGRQDPPNPDERKSTDHQSEKRPCRETCRSLLEDSRREHPGGSQRSLYREACRGNVDKRIPRVPLSTVQKVYKRLIQQFENHPIRELLLQDFKKLRRSIHSVKSRRT